MAYKSKEKEKAHRKAYRKANREMLNARAIARYHAKHPDAIRDKNYHKLIDHCKGCGRSFDEVQRFTVFRKGRGNKLHGRNKCVDCMKLQFSAYNEKIYKKYYNLKYQMIKAQGGKCAICGYDDLSCLACFDFHHPDQCEKDKDIVLSLWYGPSEKSLKEWKAEAAKCIIICSNCHRKIHTKHKELCNYAYKN